RAEFVAAAQLQALRQVARAHHVVHVDEARHRHRDRAVQRKAGVERDQQRDPERRRERDFRARHRVADRFCGFVGLGAVFVDQRVCRADHAFPGGRELDEGGLCIRLRGGCRVHRLVELGQISIPGGAEDAEVLAVRVAKERGLVLGRHLIELLQQSRHPFEILLRRRLAAVDEERAFERRIAFVGGRAQGRREIKAGHRVVAHAERFVVHHAQPAPRDRGHHQHQHEQRAEAQHDPVAERETGRVPGVEQGGVAGAGRRCGHCR
ncbi:conserved hypothetical protein, partial [Ricinus communis]